MIIALQTLVFFRHTLLAVLDRILRPYYKRLILSFRSNGPAREEEETDDQVYSEFDKDKGVVFFPPMYVQRYAAVSDCLMDERWCGKLQKVADLGYCDMSFIRYLKDVPGVQTILGVDVEKVPLRCAWDMLGYEDYPFKSDNALHVLLLQGNAADPDYRLIGCDAVVAIEMIEHMLPHDLERLVHTIFGFVKPMVVVITTPNKDFNVLFTNMGKNGMRHWDHRFEWTREQFNDWCSNIVVRYPNYGVICKGVGPPPPGTQYVGCCSQLALFCAKEYHKQQDLNPDSLRVLVSASPEPENSVLDLGWEEPSETEAILSPNSTISPTSLFNQSENSMKIPVKLSNSTILLPALTYRDKMLQCNLPAEIGKSFMMFSDEHEYCWTLLPRRRGDGDNRVYDIEDVASRLNCTTLQVKKFSKTTQRLFAHNKLDSLANTRHVVEEIKHLTKMLNFNRNISNENINSSATWNNINWGDNAPFWNQYYTVIREYKYPFETKSEECLILELISDEIHRMLERQVHGEDELAVDPTTLEIPLTHLTEVVRHITTDEERVRDLLEWNGYEIVGNMVLHHRTLVRPEDESDDGNWRENGSCEWDIGSDHSDASSIPDFYGRSLRRALDRKVRRLSCMSEADMDISTELDLVVCRLLKLALRMSNGCELPLHPRWLECKLYDLLSLTEKSINRKKTRNCATLSFRAIDYGMEQDRSQRLSLIREHDEVSMKRIEDSYRHLVQFKDTPQYVVEESLHSDHMSQSSPVIPLSTICTSKRMDSDYDTSSPLPARRGMYIEEDYKSYPISSSAENIHEGVQSWTSEDLVCSPFLHQPSQCDNSTDDTDGNGKDKRQKSPTKKKRKVVFPTECSVAADIETSRISPTIFTDDSGQYKTRNKKEKNSKINRKANQKSSYNSLMKSYAMHLAQAEKVNEMSRKVVHYAEQPSAVKPIPCSLINLCYEELVKENGAVREWSPIKNQAEDSMIKEPESATEETQIMSVVMDEIVGLQENMHQNDTAESHDTCSISGVNRKPEDNVRGDIEPLFLSDLNEPSTSKGIRHVNMDAQCGPDTGSLDIPLLTRTPSIKLQKIFKTGIVIGDSSTELTAETKEIIDFATSTSDNYAMRNVSSITEGDGVQKIDMPAKTMCDASTLSRPTKRNDANRGSIPELVHKSVSSATTDAITYTLNAKTEAKQGSTTMFDESYSLSLRHNGAVETNLIKAVSSKCNKIDDSLSDHSALCGTYSPRMWKQSLLLFTPSPQHKEVQSTDTSVHGLRSLYDKQYAPPKLSFVGAQVHSYKEREGSEDILYQGVWQKHKMQWAPNKRSHSDIAPKKPLVTTKPNSKENSRPYQSTSDIKSSAAVAVKRTVVKSIASKDFVSKNIMLSGKESCKEPKAKKTYGPKKSAAPKTKQNSCYKKTALLVDKKRQLAGPVVVKKEQAIPVKTKQNVSPTINVAIRKPHYVSINVPDLNKDKLLSNSASYFISKEENGSDNAPVSDLKHIFLSAHNRITKTTPDCVSKKITLVETKPDFISRNTMIAETKPDFMPKHKTIDVNPSITSHKTFCEGNIFGNAVLSEPKLVNTHSMAKFMVPKSDFVTRNTTFIETKPDIMSKKSMETKSCFPNYTKVIEMQPECNDVRETDADPEFLSSFESLAKLKQDIISSNEVLARLQQDFEQKVEKRILGSRNRKILNNKNNYNKVPSKNSLSILKPEKARQNQTLISGQKTAYPKPRMEQTKKMFVKPIDSASKTLIKKTSLKNVKGAKTYQRSPSTSSNVPTNRKRVNFKDQIHMKRPSSASPTVASAKAAVKVNSYSPMKSPVRTPVRTPVRPRSADAGVMKHPPVSRPPVKRSIWMPKQSAETKKLTKDLLKAHVAALPGRNFLAYCSELEGSDSTDCSTRHEDPDTIRGKFYVSSSHTSSNCSSPNSVITVRPRLQKPISGRQTASMSKVTTFKEGKKPTAPKAAPKRKKHCTNKDRSISPTPVLKVNLNEKNSSSRRIVPADYNRNIYVAQLSPETASPLCLSPSGRKCLSPNRLTSLKQVATPAKPILRITDLEESSVLNETSTDEFTLSGSSSNTLSQVEPTRSLQPLVVSQPSKELNDSTKVVVLGSKMSEDVTEAAHSEVITVMREIIEDTLKEIGESLVNPRSRWPSICARTSSSTFSKEKRPNGSQRGISKVSIRIDELEGHDLSVADNAKISSIKDLYERKEQLSYKPAGSLAIQAFSGFSMNSPPPTSAQKPDYVNIIDSETGSTAATIPTRLAASEELYISGRSSESYQSCMVDDEIVVPDWLFHVVSHDDEYENQYDDDEENYPMPMPTRAPVPAIALQEGLDLNGNLAEGVPTTVARTGAGDGRGIHSDQSQDSSGHGTSLTSSANSSGPHSTMVIDPTVYPSRYDSMLESLSDDDTGEAESSRPGRQRTSEAGTPMSSTERIYTLLNQVATSDVDADVSSIDTDDNVSRSHEL